MHVLGFYQSIAQNSLLQLAGVSDPIYFSSSGRFLIQKPQNIYWALAIGTTIARARLQTPSYTPQGYPYIGPLQRPAIGTGLVNVANYLKGPLPIPPKQYLEAQAEQTSAGAEIEAVIVGIGDRLDPAMPGMVTRIRGTSTTAAVAGSWTQLAMTWEYTLEGGYYQVVGGQIFSTTGIAFRVISQFQVERPGAPMIRNLAQANPQMFDAYGMGKWCDFESEAMPQIEVLCGAADAAFTAYLDVVKVR